MKATPLCLIVLAACGGSKDKSEKLGDLAFTVPASWQRHDAKAARGRLATELTPEDNDHKESISIIRTELRPSLRQADAETLERLLVNAQQTLPSADVHEPTQLTTPNGLNAVEIESEFVPRGMTVSYHRVHALVLDGTALVHVLYTARTPDPDLKTFHLVLDSIHRGEG